MRSATAPPAMPNISSGSHRSAPMTATSQAELVISRTTQPITTWSIQRAWFHNSEASHRQR